MTPYAWYGNLVENVQPIYTQLDFMSALFPPMESLNQRADSNLEDLLEGMYDGSPYAAEKVIDASIERIIRAGFTPDKNAKSDLLLYADGFYVQRVRRYWDRYAKKQDGTLLQEIILLLTIPYYDPNPPKKPDYSEEGDYLDEAALDLLRKGGD